MKYIVHAILAVLLASPAAVHSAEKPATAGRPNLLLIVGDDLGYGGVGCYGATKINTPRIDRLAGEGARFTDAHSVAAVCNPSRYSILSGTYLWHAKRRNDYSLYFHEGQATLPSLLQSAGYHTAALGKWHNGFGRNGNPDWNGELKPGPLEIGFDYFFGTPRTHNEPPFVFVENHRVVGWDPADPIRIVPHAEVVKRGLRDWGWGISEGGAAAHAARPDERIDFILAEKAAKFLEQQPGGGSFFRPFRRSGLQFPRISGPVDWADHGGSLSAAPSGDRCRRLLALFARRNSRQCPVCHRAAIWAKNAGQAGGLEEVWHALNSRLAPGCNLTFALPGQFISM